MALLDESYFPKDTGALGNAALGVRSFLNLLGGRVVSPSDLHREDQFYGAMDNARLGIAQGQADAYKVNNMEALLKLKQQQDENERQQTLRQGASDLYRQMNTPFTPSPRIAEPGLADMERTLGQRAPAFTPDWSPPSETEQYKRLGQYYAGQGDVATADKIMDTLNKGREKVKDWKQTIGANGQPVYTPLFESGAVGQSGPAAVQDLPEGFTYGPNGQMAPIDDYWRLKKEQAAAGASRVNVGMPAITLNTEKTYAGNVAEGLAKNDVNTIDQGKAGLQAVKAAHSIMQALDSNKVIVGPLAEYRMGAERVAGLFGLSGEDGLAQTRAMMQNQAQLVLAARKQMQGQGQITDRESALAERVAGGDISMSPAEIRTMAQLAEKAGRLQIRSANNVAARLKDHPAFGTVGQQIMIDEPPQYKGQQPAPSNSGSQQPKSKFFNVGGKQLIGQLGADGSYYVNQGGKRYRIEE